IDRYAVTQSGFESSAHLLDIEPRVEPEAQPTGGGDAARGRMLRDPPGQLVLDGGFGRQGPPRLPSLRGIGRELRQAGQKQDTAAADGTHPNGLVRAVQSQAEAFHQYQREKELELDGVAAG